MITRIKDENGKVVYQCDTETIISILEPVFVHLYPGQTNPLRLLPKWKIETEE